MQEILRVMVSGVPDFTGERDRWVKLGLFTKEEINNSIVVKKEH